MLSDKSDNNPLEVFQFLLAMGLDVNTIFTNGKRYTIQCHMMIYYIKST
jgi:hypothetical protein